MKSILIVLGIIVIGGVVWYGIQTKPDASVPQAVVTDVDVNSTNVDEKKMVADESINIPVVPKSKEIDNVNVKIAFTGFGPGKKHVGSFSKIDSKLTLIEDKIGGEIVVDMNSLTTDTEDVTKHLKTDAFFDVAKYPTATFKVLSFEGVDAQGGNASGVFTIKGKSRQVSFPFTLTKSSNGNTVTGYSAKFNINMKEFGIDQKFANEVIELAITVPLK